MNLLHREAETLAIAGEVHDDAGLGIETNATRSAGLSLSGSASRSRESAAPRPAGCSSDHGDHDHPPLGLRDVRREERLELLLLRSRPARDAGVGRVVVLHQVRADDAPDLPVDLDRELGAVEVGDRLAAAVDSADVNGDDVNAGAEGRLLGILGLRCSASLPRKQFPAAQCFPAVQWRPPP